MKSRDQNSSREPSSLTENIKHGKVVWENPFRWTLSLARWLQFIFSHHISKTRFNMFHLRLDFSRWFLTFWVSDKKFSIDYFYSSTLPAQLIHFN